MTGVNALWKVIQAVLPSDRYVRLPEIYRLVESSIALTPEDFEPDAPGSGGLRWKRNVRNVLQTQKQDGAVLWDPGNASYRLASPSNVGQRDRLGETISPRKSNGPSAGQSVSAPSSRAPIGSAAEQSGESGSNMDAVDLTPPERVPTEIRRIVRDTAAVQRLKRLHDNTCQICGHRVVLFGSRAYSEGHHLQPLGSPHDGYDGPDNIIIVCPNCHVLCDYGAIRLMRSRLRTVLGHSVSPSQVRYHNETVYRVK